MTFPSEARQRRDSLNPAAQRPFAKVGPEFEPEPFDEWLDRTTKELARKVRASQQGPQERQSSAKPSPTRATSTKAASTKTRARALGKPHLRTLKKGRSRLIESAPASLHRRSASGAQSASLEQTTP